MGDSKREQKGEDQREGACVCVCVHACVRVCVCERERGEIAEKERQRKGEYDGRRRSKSAREREHRQTGREQDLKSIIFFYCNCILSCFSSKCI